ncbi:DUF4124 domain-containing protein [Sedimenticola sp.]|uniref:DUF4124 domain-containing protein n=1 Tax=Sedimenticola sp. TaxID=1940285 RepID=UPI003D0D6BFE
MKKLLFFSLIAFTLASQAAIYKWVDSRGEVHYSDTPTRDAEEVQLSDPTIYTPTGSGASKLNDQSTNRPPEQPIHYSSFVILSPNNNEVVLANNGSVVIRFQSQPALQPGHYIQPVLDGRILDQRLGGNELVLNNIERGGHMLHASIHDAGGRLQARSNIVQFFVRQVSVVEDGKSPTPPASGSSGTSGADAPQFKPGSKPDYSGQAPAESGSDASAYKPNGKSISTTPGQSNPAFKPNY